MFENRTERGQYSSHEQTCFLLKKKLKNLNTPLRVVKKPVESQYSSSSRKKTHTFTIIASLRKQLNKYKKGVRLTAFSLLFLSLQ